MNDNAIDADFRTWLVIEIERQKLSQSELARMSGVPQPTIQRIISGETTDPRISTVTMLRQTLGRHGGGSFDIHNTFSHSTSEQDFLADFRKLSAVEKKVVVRMVRSLVLDK